ncbi:MAG: hypothetical protein R3B99_07445 [Polyangiales bacterium]
MSTFDATRAECSVFTYKDGLLSKIAHDLRVKVERFEVKVDGAERNGSDLRRGKSLRVAPRARTASTRTAPLER